MNEKFTLKLYFIFKKKEDAILKEIHNCYDKINNTFTHKKSGYEYQYKRSKRRRLPSDLHHPIPHSL